MGKTTIEWTRNEDGSPGTTWNPVRGCRKVSPGCDHCYAETFAERFRGVPGHPYEAGFDPRYVPEHLTDPLRWRTPRTVFVNSMSDLFQGAFSGEQIASVFGVMAACPRHTFQVLTKRSLRLRKWHAWLLQHAIEKADSEGGGPCNLSPWWRVAACAQHVSADLVLSVAGMDARWPLPNVWQGVSVESRDYLSRIEDLRATPAAVRFLSLEPLLEDLGTIDLTGIDWVIVGGESGRGARPIAADWVRSIRDQCEAAGVAFFFKQWGGLSKKRFGRELDGRTYDAMPPRTETV